KTSEMTLQTSNIKHWIGKNWAIILILILAAFLRLYRIADYMTFLGDEGRDVLVVYKILHGHLTLLGPTASVGGFFLGPIYYYFMAPFLFLFGYSPVGPAVMVALFGIATVWLVYRVGNDFFGGGGLIASFFYAISPLVINYSRSSWNPNLLPFFSLLCLYLLYKAKSWKMFIFCGFLFGILMQLHYITVFLGVIIAFYILIITRLDYKKTSIAFINLMRRYGLFLAGFIVGWSPFLAFEFRHGFPNTKSILNFIFHSGNTGANTNFFQTVYEVFFRLFARLLTNFPPPGEISRHTDIFLWRYATLLLALAGVSFLIYKLIRAFYEDSLSLKKMSLLALWLFLGVLLFGFYKKPIYDYYFEFMFPLPFLMVGGALNFAQLKIRSLRRMKFFLFVPLVLVLLFLAWVNLKDAPFTYYPNRQLLQSQTISRFILNRTGGKPFNFALITSSNSDFAYRYFFTLWGNPPVTIQNSIADPKRKTVTGQLLVVCESIPCYPLGNSLWEIAGFGRAQIIGFWNVSVVKVYKLIHYKK
ncbi:MAG: glycosyltransferase family 39 protein, partial [Patescibacteria group bacterium]|nr:glycosyltransferase family 39 protein [Patescibacteria group bacterium]